MPDAVLEAARQAGLLKPGGRQRTDSTHVLAAVRDLNRLQFVTETLRAALNALAAAAPDWLAGIVEAEWFDRYSARSAPDGQGNSAPRQRDSQKLGMTDLPRRVQHQDATPPRIMVRKPLTGSCVSSKTDSLRTRGT
jgi:hypothetical protein